MSCVCDKEVFFRDDSRDTSQLLYLLLTVHKHDLLDWKNQRFCPVENYRKGKSGLRQCTYYQPHQDDDVVRSSVSQDRVTVTLCTEELIICTQYKYMALPRYQAGKT
jgi:hypothetical protein